MGRGKSKKGAASKKRAAASSPPPPPDPVLSEADKELERIDKLFYTYANDSSGLIDPEGIEIMCSHLGVAHTDIRMLILAWKMQAGRQGYFTLEEWRNGAKELKADTIENLKKAFGQLEEEVQKDYKVITMDQWLGFYRFLGEISFPDFSNYDEELAWPLILDDFVDWMREKAVLAI
nr:DCN1-like protein 4 [Ipomoea batatas]